MAKFDASCLRCDDINEIDFGERFGGYDNDEDLANNFIIGLHDGFVAYCENCEIETIQIPVTLIKK